MASYKGHLAFSATLGIAYGAVAHRMGEIDPATAIVGAGLTTVGGLLPDLDSDSGVPVREMFSLAAVVAPLLLWRKLQNANMSDEQILVFAGGVYLFVRFGLSKLFRHLTVHRGMFHSIPGMLIAGLIVYLTYHHPLLRVRLFLAVGVMIGFLSHLVLDEMCSIDFHGVAIKRNQFAGSAVKFFSPSAIGTITTYLVLTVLAYFAILDYEKLSGKTLLPDELRFSNFIRQTKGWDSF